MIFGFVVSFGIELCFVANSQVSARLIRRVFCIGVTVVWVVVLTGGSPALCASDAPVIMASVGGVRFVVEISGLWGEDGDDVIEALISLVGAGTLMGDQFAVELETSFLMIGLRGYSGGDTMTCNSVSCSSAWGTG